MDDVIHNMIIMYVNGTPFLTTISKNIKYCTAMWVANCTALTIANLVESVLKLYHWASFEVTEVCVDHEFKPALYPHPPRQWMVLHNQSC